MTGVGLEVMDRVEYQRDHAPNHNICNWRFVRLATRGGSHGFRVLDAWYCADCNTVVLG